MLNIITRQFESINGPNKVVKNLIKGLEKINYPYVINKDINSTKRLYIPNNIFALNFLNKTSAKTILGPNLFVLPKDIPRIYNIKNAIYLQNSKWTYDLWLKLGFDKEKLKYWPCGIDTEEFTNVWSKDINKPVLIYYKQRDPNLLIRVKQILNEKNIKYNIIKYGYYNENEFKNALANCSFIIWLGSQESQGIALQEALSSNVPMIVIDAKSLFDTFDKNGYEFPEDLRNFETTSVPYFDNRCGLVIRHLDELSEAIDNMFSLFYTFNPRDYILENLNLRKQATEFIKFYEYWDLTIKDGFSEKLLNEKEYKEPIVFKILMKIKNRLPTTFFNNDQ